MGRIRRLPEIYSNTGDYKKDGAVRSQAERQAINFPTQSFSSDLAIIGMFLFNKAIKEDPELKGNVKILFFIHDNIIFVAIFNTASFLSPPSFGVYT